MIESTSSSTSEPPEQPTILSEADSEPVDPRRAFQLALGRYLPASLVAIAQARAFSISDADRPGALAAELSAQLDSPVSVTRQLKDLSTGSRLALSLFALTETTVKSLAGLSHALATLGVDPSDAIVSLLQRGLLALETSSEVQPVEDLLSWIEGVPASAIRLRVHPSVPRVVRVPRPEGHFPQTTTSVVQIRESDGLEPILRLAALWQRVGVEPLRQTQQGTLYKRDQERIVEDPVLVDPVSDAPVSVSNLPALWLALALRVGLLRRAPEGDRLEAVAAEFWSENAVHLPQMIATSWLGLREWRDVGPGPGESMDPGHPAISLRPVILLWLACLADEEWISIDDLASHLRSVNPRWDMASFQNDSENPAKAVRRARGRAGTEARPEGLLGPLLLGSGYSLGLVRTAEEPLTARRVVQLTALGRYVLAMGPPPPARPTFEHFLFVQPNLEIIAYRQGLTPQLIGQLSRFAWWTKLGAALELRLTQESVHFGLEGGQTAEQMLNTLNRHSQRALPTLVPDAVGRWTERREQISFYTAATLLEFGSVEERDLALAAWGASEPNVFVPIAARFLLVESPDKIPTDRIRSGGARDYRHPPEKCVSIQPDGVTLVLDPLRTDLLIDAELAQIADEIPTSRSVASAPAPRRYVITSDSLKRAMDLGITAARISEWIERRSGVSPSPAIQLLLRALSGATLNLDVRRSLVLTTPTAELADGLMQHPTTAPLLGERLGPRFMTLPEENLESLRRVLLEFGLRLPS